MVSARTSIPAHPCTSNVSAQHHRARRSTSHLDEAGLIRHRPRTRNGGSAGVGILLVASIESQLLGVISLGALAIFTGLSMTFLSTGFGAALASRPLRSSLAAVAPGLGVASFAFAIWYGAAAWTLAPYPF
jgi:hypothetical protein